MQAGREEPSEDDMREGDLGDGMAARSSSRLRSKGDFPELLTHTRLSKRVSEGNEPFSWTTCSAMYAALREQFRDSDCSVGDSSEVLQRRLQEVTEEVELLRTELEVTHRHLEGKHEALRILQGQAILDKATSHTKSLLQKSEERAKALEKEVNALQWEITFNQVQFKNVEHAWELKYERVRAENEALRKAVDEKLEQLQDLRTENTSLSQQCLELLGLLSAQERRDFQKTQPPSKQGREGSALELAVYGACQCSSSVGEPCSCAKSAAASRKQVLQLKQELELQRRRKEEAYVMMDAFRIAFEQQLRRGSEKVLQLTENDRLTPRHSKPEKGKHSSASVAQRMRRFLPSAREGKVPSDPTENLHLLLDLLSDKEEALAHQRKVSYMLARSSEELEKRLQTQLRELDLSKADPKLKAEAPEQVKCDGDDGCKCSVDCSDDHTACLSSNKPDSAVAAVDLAEEQSSAEGQVTTEAKCESDRVEEES
ncbi:coiled-coil domain-containing protein 125 [Colossoma macropomum]|uniref:coiled-coil domain-containing protein 125 n=1 Tax=Colossoma macropomum TaxID=42526 RepID=UPI001863E400|nr:coiled-coil domain-containing protein 125 [Colossoma macropomum]XP_036454503.1 coiled-coil domain-containing protein 125 [Colossoma macropomum]XP_036454504.1 coiled-coil domain-containing protein 125 [Colossoma macropomum]